MATICVADGFDVDPDGRLVYDLQPGCNAMSVTGAGVGVMGVDRFDQVPRFGDDDYAEGVAAGLGPFATVTSTTFVGLDAAVDTTVSNPSECRPMLWMAFMQHFTNWNTGTGPGRLVIADLNYIDGVLVTLPSNEHSLPPNIGVASLSLSGFIGPFLLSPGGSVTVSTQPAWRAEGAIAAATISDIAWSIRTVGWFV